MSDSVANHSTEVIWIGLPGPTHYYGGLSSDNRASAAHQGQRSSPRAAALEALALARLLRGLGIVVGVLPPQLRPHLPGLRAQFSGDDATLIEHAARHHPILLEAMSSSSAMWVANAATVTPAQDSHDGCMHLTVANLHTNLHRRIEAPATYAVLRQIFCRVPRTVVDMPLDASAGFRDEGAANHMRLAPSHDAPGFHVFVYGTDDNSRDPSTARQTLATSQEIIARHRLQDGAAICIKQNPQAIMQGVFHNDVIAVSHQNFLLVHEDAYALGTADLDYISDSYQRHTGQELQLCVIRRDELSIEEAVQTYLFNSQLLSLSGGGMALIAPQETQAYADGKAWKLLERIRQETGNPITELHAVSLHQSMRNGGGPACLRLRVLLQADQLAALQQLHPRLLDAGLFDRLETVVEQHYPSELSAADLTYDLYHCCRTTLDALGHAMGLSL